MKKNLTKILSVILIAVLILCLLPFFTKRISSEKKNTNVVVSLYYNDIANRLRGKKLDDAIDNFKAEGVTVMSFSEENLNSMIARGDITNIKYNVLRHKFDDESLALAAFIAEHGEIKDKIIYDSQLIITKNKAVAEMLSETLSHRFTKGNEYDILDFSYGENAPMTVFCIYNGTLPSNEVQLGYNENAISSYYDAGFDICLIVRLIDSTERTYLDNIERLIKQYNVKYISIRASTVKPDNPEDAKEHYTGLSRLIKDNNLTLVVTENPNQLSNEAPFGYKQIFNENSSKVLRSYETYDASQDEDTHYKFRYHQYLNSTIDRNIRFITVSQIHLANKSYEECTALTIKAVSEYIDKITELGYSVNGDTPELDYNADLRIPNAISAVIMVLMMYIILCILTNKYPSKLFVAALILSAVAFAASYLAPQSLVWAFPTAWAVLAPCFALTVVLKFIKEFLDRLPTLPLVLITVALLVGCMCVLGIVQSSLLSGINYYVNNDIFRGIKLSLFLPLIFALILYVVMFLHIDYRKLGSRLVNSTLADIKIIYIIVIAVLFVIGYAVLSVYIRRSGNVNSISSIESAMRNFITDVFEARPRTKEFLIGYPCLVLFVWYLKKTNIRLIQAVLFCGAAITAASISNTFCHVFTTVEVIYGRVINGVILGIICAAVVYIANIIIVKIVCKYFRSHMLPRLSKSPELYSMYKLFIGERN